MYDISFDIVGNGSHLMVWQNQQLRGNLRGASYLKFINLLSKKIEYKVHTEYEIRHFETVGFSCAFAIPGKQEFLIIYTDKFEMWRICTSQGKPVRLFVRTLQDFTHLQEPDGNILLKIQCAFLLGTNAIVLLLYYPEELPIVQYKLKHTKSLQVIHNLGKFTDECSCDTCVPLFSALK